MDLGTVLIDPAEARAKVDEYAAVLAAERTAEDSAILAAYRAAARGLGVISLAATFQRAGWFDNGLPRLAIVRADARDCFVRWDRFGRGRHLVFADHDNVNANQGALVGAHTVRVPVADPPEQRTSSWQAASTIVPIVPPEHRPRRPRRLSRCHVLWEVESWTRIPPKDPALLWHIRGDMWAVLATWDLTELERLVLAQ